MGAAVDRPSVPICSEAAPPGLVATRLRRNGHAVPDNASQRSKPAQLWGHVMALIFAVSKPTITSSPETQCRPADVAGGHAGRPGGLVGSVCRLQAFEQEIRGAGKLQQAPHHW